LGQAPRAARQQRGVTRYAAASDVIVHTKEVSVDLVSLRVPHQPTASREFIAALLTSETERKICTSGQKQELDAHKK